MKRLLVLALLVLPGLCIADDLHDAYSAMDYSYRMREARKKDFDSYANSGQVFNPLISQLQTAQQIRIQRETLEEMRRADQESEWERSIIRRRIEREERRRQFCENSPDYCK